MTSISDKYLEQVNGKGYSGYTQPNPGIPTPFTRRLKPKTKPKRSHQLWPTTFRQPTRMMKMRMFMTTSMMTMMMMEATQNERILQDMGGVAWSRADLDRGHAQPHKLGWLPNSLQLPQIELKTIVAVSSRTQLSCPVVSVAISPISPGNSPGNHPKGPKGQVNSKFIVIFKEMCLNCSLDMLHISHCPFPSHAHSLPYAFKL